MIKTLQASAAKAIVLSGEDWAWMANDDGLPYMCARMLIDVGVAATGLVNQAAVEALAKRLSR